ncbi:MAG: tetratricopeptide repeat protein [Vicinamibacterales bacterium]
MKTAAACLMSLVLGAPAFARTPPPAPGQDPAPVRTQAGRATQADAYYAYMEARRLEGEGDVAGARAALERALKLDPDAAELHAELAGFHARQNEAVEAEREARRALELDADNVEAHRILGLVYSAWAQGMDGAPAGRSEASLRDDAITHLARILDTPAVATDLNLQLSLARLYLEAKRADDAVPVLENVASQAPYASEPFSLLAQARLAQGEVDLAIEALRRAGEINPRYLVSAGELLDRQRRYGEAADTYEAAIDAVEEPTRDLFLRFVTSLLNVPNGEGAQRARDELAEFTRENPKDSRALYLLSTAERQLGNGAAAEAAARSLVALEPDSISGLYALSLALFERRDYRGVVQALQPFAADGVARSQGREADGALLLAQLGVAHLRLDEPEPAVQAFTRARALEPGQARYASYLAEALARAGRPADGARVLEQAVAEQPNQLDLVVALADFYSDQHRYDDAVKVLDRASSQAGGDNTGLLLQLGAVYENAGRYGDAEREFRRILERDPLHAPALNYLGYMLADQGERLDEAVTLIERALTVDPGNASYQDSLGWALFKQGKFEAAEGYLSKAAGQMADNSVIQEHYGDVLARLGKNDAAVAAWRQALAGDGQDIDRASIERKIRDAGRR